MVGTLTPEQEELLRDTWEDKGAWTYGRDSVRHPLFGGFPATPVALEQYDDSAEGITQHQLTVFIEELKNGHRCVTCASPEDVFENGRCAQCLISEED
jgi:hypothetical protein